MVQRGRRCAAGRTLKPTCSEPRSRRDAPRLASCRPWLACARDGQSRTVARPDYCKAACWKQPAGLRVMQDLRGALLKSVRERSGRMPPSSGGLGWVALDRLFALCIVIANCREFRRVGFPDYPESFISGHADLAGVIVSLSRPFAIQWGSTACLAFCFAFFPIGQIIAHRRPLNDPSGVKVVGQFEIRPDHNRRFRLRAVWK